jgi:hypothetical protein
MKHKLIELLSAADEVLRLPDGPTTERDPLLWYDGDSAEDCGEDGAFLENYHEDRWFFDENQEVELGRGGSASVWLHPGDSTSAGERHTLLFRMVRPMLASDVKEQK